MPADHETRIPAAPPSIDDVKEYLRFVGGKSQYLQHCAIQALGALRTGAGFLTARQALERSLRVTVDVQEKLRLALWDLRRVERRETRPTRKPGRRAAWRCDDCGGQVELGRVSRLCAGCEADEAGDGAA